MSRGPQQATHRSAQPPEAEAAGAGSSHGSGEPLTQQCPHHHSRARAEASQPPAVAPLSTPPGDGPGAATAAGRGIGVPRHPAMASSALCCSPPSLWPASCRRRGGGHRLGALSGYGRLVAGSCGAPFPVDVRLGAAAIERPLQGRAAHEQPEGRPGNRVGSCSDCPRWGRWAAASSGFPMASPLSVGIELQPPGVDQRWVRIWVLDRSAAPSARCRLVVRDAALRRARELQAAHGAGAVWWV